MVFYTLCWREPTFPFIWDTYIHQQKFVDGRRRLWYFLRWASERIKRSAVWMYVVLHISLFYPFGTTKISHLPFFHQSALSLRISPTFATAERRSIGAGASERSLFMTTRRCGPSRLKKEKRRQQSASQEKRDVDFSIWCIHSFWRWRKMPRSPVVLYMCVCDDERTSASRTYEPFSSAAILRQALWTVKVLTVYQKLFFLLAATHRAQIISLFANLYCRVEIQSSVDFARIFESFSPLRNSVHPSALAQKIHPFLIQKTKESIAKLFTAAEKLKQIAFWEVGDSFAFECPGRAHTIPHVEQKRKESLVQNLAFAGSFCGRQDFLHSLSAACYFFRQRKILSCFLFHPFACWCDARTDGMRVWKSVQRSCMKWNHIFITETSPRGFWFWCLFCFWCEALSQWVWLMFRFLIRRAN